MAPGHHDFGFVVVIAARLPALRRGHRRGPAGPGQVTGRLAAWVMNDLRVKVFTHLQRLSLDFFTEEKAGVVMSRMTSDIENLQQLLQDGLAQFAIQGLTMVVITVILFTTNVRLAFITVVLIIPAAGRRVACGSSGPPSAATTGSATASPTCWPTCPRACTACASSPPTTASATTSIHHRNVVGDYRDANNYTAHVNAIYGPGTQLLGVLGQAVLLAIGGDMVLHHQLSSSARWSPSSSTSTGSSSPSSCWSSSTTPTSRARPR